jgi:hypothetical protein
MSVAHEELELPPEQTLHGIHGEHSGSTGVQLGKPVREHGEHWEHYTTSIGSTGNTTSMGRTEKHGETLPVLGARGALGYWGHGEREKLQLLEERR